MQQLLHDNFLTQLDETLQVSQLRPQELELELTESVFSHDADRVLALVTELHKLGIAHGFGVAVEEHNLVARRGERLKQEHP